MRMLTTVPVHPGGIVITMLLLAPIPSAADDQRLELGATATGVLQAGDYDDALDSEGRNIGNTSRGSLAVDLEASAAVGSSGLVFGLASFAEGNGLDGAGGVSVRVNADDLEDDVKNINGTGRDYLLEAWYAHHFDLGPSTELELTGGLIDATRYIDSNRVANDEIHQFMNEVFVNRFFLPSYDPGLALSLTSSDWSAYGVWMDARADEASGRTRDFDFYGLQVGRRYELPIGEGNLRLIGLKTSDSFGDDRSSVRGIGFSMDQSWGEHVMLFARGGGFSDEESVLVHDSLYSAGLQISGHRSPRSRWVAGLAYAYLDGAGNGPGDVRETRVIEGYLRRIGKRRFGATLDIQYVADELNGESNPSLWCIGLRANYTF